MLQTCRHTVVPWWYAGLSTDLRTWYSISKRVCSTFRASVAVPLASYHRYVPVHGVLWSAFLRVFVLSAPSASSRSSVRAETTFYREVQALWSQKLRDITCIAHTARRYRLVRYIYRASSVVVKTARQNMHRTYLKEIHFVFWYDTWITMSSGIVVVRCSWYLFM